MAELRIGATAKRVVVARTIDGELFTIGPVYSDDAATELATEVHAETAEEPFEVLGVAPAFSRAEFRSRT